MLYPIEHPIAKRISVITRAENILAMGTENGELVEIAFFDANNEWVTETIPEFAEYADLISGDTRVYGWVPNYLVEDFLEIYA